MDDTGNVTQNGQQNVDEEIGAAATLEEDTHGREDDGKDDLADVAVVSQYMSCLLVASSSRSSSRIRGKTSYRQLHCCDMK